MKGMFDFIHDHVDQGASQRPETLQGDHISWLDDHFNFSAMDRSMDKELAAIMVWMYRFYSNCPGSFEVNEEVGQKIAHSYKRGDDPWEAAAALVEGRWKPGASNRL